MKRAVLMLAALGASSLTSGCAAMALGAAARAGMMIAQDRTPGQNLDDAAVSGQVKARLLAYDTRAFSRVDVEVALGEVLLSGTTPNDQSRMDAERIAWGVGGVRKVDNQILTGRSPGVVTDAHDEWITARVRAKLIADKAVKGIDFNIETHQGVVYLMGLARTDDEARRVAQATSFVGGVKKVVSYIQVRPQAPTWADRGVAGAPIETPGTSHSLTASMESPDTHPTY